ncbi:sugar transferase [Epibacterium ulvae]|uniref:sugar transferase n=1 Tax=Epibacterium ulvae TaxID=1156985 RepID=UPI001BFC0438|nr:sugar transferase [Epibacterium ulvae]MBT8154505.1 sugar transferase [Epibacterium ulvae]
MGLIDMRKMSLPHTSESAQIPPAKFYLRIGKRLLDLTLVLIAAPIVVPLILTLALVVARDGGKPFYRQTRVGRGGRAFTMWKVRSMVHQADEKLAAYLEKNPKARAEWDEKQKLSQDPRITRFGRMLRKSSLDELPQFWNVFRGDMSLVGPRPMMPDQQVHYPGTAYYDMRPGITGSWQVSARNEASFSDRAWFDNAYALSISLRQDVRLLAATVRVVVQATGR